MFPILLTKDKRTPNQTWNAFKKRAQKFINNERNYRIATYDANPSGRRRHEKSEHSETQTLVVSPSHCDTIKLREHP